MSDAENVLQFMVVRAPTVPDPIASRRSYIKDELLLDGRVLQSDLFSSRSSSAIGKLVYTAIFCPDDAGATPTETALTSRILSMLEWYEPACPNETPGGAINLQTLQSRTFFQFGQRFYVVPDRLRFLETPMTAALPRLADAMNAASLPIAGQTVALDVMALHKEVTQILGGNIVDAVFTGNSYALAYRHTKRALFDALYLLYILRRLKSLSLEDIIRGLQVLHVLEALAIDEFLLKIKAQAQVSAGDRPLLNALIARYPSLATWSFGALPTGFPLIANRGDLDTYLTAVPVIHPIFAQLCRFRKPFNPIKPIGIGDLKVVKHWLVKYKAGDIAHIDNVLLGETKTRVLRHLEKSEDTFTSSSAQTEETTRDTQTTDRFELQREADSVIKSDLSATAGLAVSASYDGGSYKVMANVTAGVAYSRSQTDQNKMASNFARDVVAKAVKRVQTQASQQRSTTKLFETEETNTHVLANNGPNAKQNISGIYRWVDKEYKAQLFNYGKRMMFEFVLPEPAAILVESRLRAYEAQLDLPTPPIKPDLEQLPLWLRNLNASQIDEARYNVLRQQYDLADSPYPADTKSVAFTDMTSGEGLTWELTDPNRTVQRWYAKTIRCRADVVGYSITKVRVFGTIYFYTVPYTPVAGVDQRLFNVEVDGVLKGSWQGSATGNIDLLELQSPTADRTVTPGSPFTADTFTVVLNFLNVHDYELVVSAELTRSPATTLAWQVQVLRKIVAIEQKIVDARNSELQTAYAARMTTYHNRLDELRATSINDLLQGQSEAFNRQIILKELKRQCISVITKDFDDDPSDDRLTKIDAMGTRPEDFAYRKLRVTEQLAADKSPTTVNAHFDVLHTEVPYPVPDLPNARTKGRYVQFLEQAFEWQQLSYLVYPYFWAHPRRWIDLMNRSDQTDPFLSAFLQAGSVRVLLAVTPAYEGAVLHYLGTGEPWDGGPAPVIGDPLFIPLYEEVRREEDDLLNAVPDGEPWSFILPTSLVYLENSSTPLPTIT